MPDLKGGRWMTATRWTTCARCAANIFRGKRFLWFGFEKLAFCEACGERHEREQSAQGDLLGDSASG